MDIFCYLLLWWWVRVKQANVGILGDTCTVMSRGVPRNSGPCAYAVSVGPLKILDQSKQPCLEALDSQLHYASQWDTRGHECLADELNQKCTSHS
uniref:Secreted protein n=1 Tax=Anguilla anguilla TaxID=7936 RepID=A0A0E9XRZ3_ANGAN